MTLGLCVKTREKFCLPIVTVQLALAIEAGCKRRDSLTVTDKKEYWVLPASVKTVSNARVKDVNLSKIPCSTSTVKPSSVPTPSETELTKLTPAALIESQVLIIFV